MLNGVHGIIVGGTQNFVGDECVHDYNGNLIQLLEKPTIVRELYVGMIRTHGAHKIASFLRQHGADVEVVDYAFSWELEELKDLWKSRYHSKTLFLCISSIFRQSSIYLWQFVDWVRQNYPHIHIIVMLTKISRECLWFTNNILHNCKIISCRKRIITIFAY